MLKGNDTSKTKDFEFTVELSKDKAPYVNSIDYIKSNNNTGRLSLDDNGQGKVTLKGDEYITFTNLQDKINYNVTEKDYTADGYKTTYENQQGTIRTDVESNLKVINEKNSSGGNGNNGGNGGGGNNPPEKPTIPPVPVEPETPSVPIDPKDPNSPEIPLLPLDPNDPESPLVPFGPLDPSDPNSPLVPYGPLDPNDPESILVPYDPLNPYIPQNPWTPDSNNKVVDLGKNEDNSGDRDNNIVQTGDDTPLMLLFVLMFGCFGGAFGLSKRRRKQQKNEK